MATKTEYREYISSEKWKERRKKFIVEAGYDRCNRCDLPRWLAVIAYDQDLHVHHKSYARIGAELDEDLEPLCRRCHEIETFGTSQLHQPKPVKCEYCHTETWNLFEPRCAPCSVLVPGGADEIIPPMVRDPLVWKNILWSLAFETSDDEILEELIRIRKCLNKDAA